MTTSQDMSVVVQNMFQDVTGLMMFAAAASFTQNL